MARYYIGLVHRDPGSDFGVSFPDFPGLVTAGRNLDDARVMAREALALHIAGMVEDGGTVPEPANVQSVMADPESQDGIAILVSV